MQRDDGRSAKGPSGLRGSSSHGKERKKKNREIRREFPQQPGEIPGSSCGWNKETCKSRLAPGRSGFYPFFRTPASLFLRPPKGPSRTGRSKAQHSQRVIGEKRQEAGSECLQRLSCQSGAPFHSAPECVDLQRDVHSPSDESLRRVGWRGKKILKEGSKI